MVYEIGNGGSGDCADGAGGRRLAGAGFTLAVLGIGQVPGDLRGLAGGRGSASGALDLGAAAGRRASRVGATMTGASIVVADGAVELDVRRLGSGPTVLLLPGIHTPCRSAARRIPKRAINPDNPANQCGTIRRMEFDDDPEKQIRELLERRKASQPIGEWSCGSVFTNPTGDHAARLIDTAGLKGFRIGDASVSEKHANFIINHGNATATDLERLIQHVRETVEKVHGVSLHPEVRVIGEAA